MSHGASVEADSIQRTAQVCPRVISTRSGLRLALSHQRMAVKRRGRRRWSRPPAREASLDRLRLAGIALKAPTARRPQVGAAPIPHCADMLNAMENSDFRKVRPCQKSCNKPLHCHTTDRSAPWALYPAIKRSMSRASPVLRNSSTNCDREKIAKSIARADSERV
jgi:hypothetical protein